MTTKEYIQLHRKDDVYKLALTKAPEGVDLQYALQQIAAYQTIEKKIPSWAECNDLIFPQKLSLEQSSSELTAQLKAALIKEFMGGEGFTHIDLTGGMGIDCYFIAQNASASHYVEQNEELCSIAQHNFAHLNPNIMVHNTTAEEFLNQMTDVRCQSTDNRVQMTDDRVQMTDDKTDTACRVPTLPTPYSLLIYLDPARRGNHGEKLVSISDCQPDVVALLPQMFELTDKVVVKLSPMLDITRAINELEHIEHLYVISVGNECKELLLFINREYSGETQIHAVNLKQSTDDRVQMTDKSSLITPHFFASLKDSCNAQHNEQAPSAFAYSKNSSLLIPHSSLLTGTLSHEAALAIPYATEVGRYLYEPYAAHLKSGLYKTMAEVYGVGKLHQHSHLYTSDELNTDFPGRQFSVTQVVPFNKKSIKSFFKEHPKANLTTRNFPLTVSQLRTQYKIKEGGELYIFATTLRDDSLVLVLCEKA